MYTDSDSGIDGSIVKIVKLKQVLERRDMTHAFFSEYYEASFFIFNCSLFSEISNSGCGTTF